MKMHKAFKTGALALALSMSAGAVLANDMKASDFVEDVFQKNYAEIEAGKIALEKSQSTEVKSFARKMIDEHTRANVKLGELAAKKDIEIKAEAGLMGDAKAMMHKLREDGNVDAAYADQQIKAHEDAVAFFEKASTTLDDSDLKIYAEGALPTLREHLTAAKKLGSKMQKVQ